MLFFKMPLNMETLLGDEDRYFAEIVRRGYFREIISTNIDDIVERVLHDVGLIEDRDFEVLIPGEQEHSTPKEKFALQANKSFWRFVITRIYNL